MKDLSIGIIPIHKSEDSNIKFCLVRHKAGHWAFPKGHPDQGETEKETAIRELREETGITNISLLNEPVLIEAYTFEKDGVIFDKIVRYFIGFTDSVDLKISEGFEDEILDLRWVTTEEARGLITFPEALKLLDTVLEAVLKYRRTP